MQRYALPMSEDTAARIPELLRAHGIAVEPHRDIAEFKVMKCRRGKAAVLLSVTKPPHWASADDERRDKVVVAAVPASLFRFWAIPRDNRLRREVIELLRPHGWFPGGSGSPA